MGALVGGGNETQINDLKDFGNHIGIAFQIRDDILDCISKEDELGKPIKKDLFMGRPSIVLLDAINSGISIERMMKCNNGELMHLVSNSIENAKRSAREEFEIAISKLDNLDNSFAKTKLNELGEYIITRSK